MTNKKVKKSCPDCGNAPVNHTIEWTSNVLSVIVEPLSYPMERIWRAIEPVVGPFLSDTISPILFKVFTTVGLGKITYAPNEKTGGRARILWEEAIRRGIDMYEFHLFGIGQELFVATYNGKTKCFEGLPRPGAKDSPGLAYMDDKEIVRERFAAGGIPVARGGVAMREHSAKKLFKTLRTPVVVKPEIGSRSRHTTTHIMTETEVVSAFDKAWQLCPWVIIEEEDVGFVYRGTVIGGKLFAVLRREPPMVIGDGVHTIAELVALENKNPRRDGKIFHTLTIDEDAKAELARQKISLEDIPAEGASVMLSQKASRGLGGGATDVTDTTHPDNKKMLEDAVAILQDPLVGIDFIIPDVTKSWKEQERCGIIECNSMPFIDLHEFPLIGEPRNAAVALWDIVFPTSSKAPLQQ